MKSFILVQKGKDIRAFLSEMGIIYSLSEFISKKPLGASVRREEIPGTLKHESITALQSHLKSTKHTGNCTAIET